ncbi:MAG TPA: sorbosone dehydrogenase family protein [Chthoniobacterales bacterium]
METCHRLRAIVASGLLGGLMASAGATGDANRDVPDPPGYHGTQLTGPLPAPFANEPANHPARIVGWSGSEQPKAPKGFSVNLFAEGFEYPRWLYVLPNGDVLVSEARNGDGPPSPEEAATGSSFAGESPDRITLLRPGESGRVAKQRVVLLTRDEGLHKPFGMAYFEGFLYVANCDAVVRYPFHPGDTQVSGAPKTLLGLAPRGYHGHWARNVVIHSASRKMYIGVGSDSNDAEHGMGLEGHRAVILEANLDGSEERIYAGGLRNPQGMDWQPVTGVLFTSVNERDGFGDDLVPDYLTSVQPGGFYGWPYSYFGQHEDPNHRGERADLVQRAIVPDVALGAHTASLGLVFCRSDRWPRKYWDGAFIGQHGSWNRSQFSGYQVAFVPFAPDGKPSGPPEAFLTGFVIDANASHGRPCGVAMTRDGALLVADDAGRRIWRVAPSDGPAQAARVDAH